MNKGTKKIRRVWTKERQIAITNNQTWRSLILQALLKKTEKKDLTNKEIRKAKKQIERVSKNE